jgi:hypothetical protein
MPLDSRASVTALEVALELTKLACPNQSLVTDLELRREAIRETFGGFLRYVLDYFDIDESSSELLK